MPGQQRVARGLAGLGASRFLASKCPWALLSDLKCPLVAPLSEPTLSGDAVMLTRRRTRTGNLCALTRRTNFPPRRPMLRSASSTSGAGARADRHRVGSAQRADGRNRNETSRRRAGPPPDAHITCTTVEPLVDHDLEFWTSR